MKLFVKIFGKIKLPLVHLCDLPDEANGITAVHACEIVSATFSIPSDSLTVLRRGEPQNCENKFTLQDLQSMGGILIILAR